MGFPEFDMEELKKQQEDAEFKKGTYGALGAVAKGFDDVPSAYNLLYGKGQATGKSHEIFDNLQKNVSDPWEKQKKTYEMYKTAKEGKALDQKETDEAALRDPSSKRAKSMKAMIAGQHGVDPKELDGFAEKDLMAIYGDPAKLAEIKARASVDFQNDMAKQRASQGFTASENAKNRQGDMDKEILRREMENNKKTDPVQRLRSLSGTDKARYDNALMVAKAVDEMGGALDNGQSTFRAIGDNDYTAAERRAAEAYGRMQSGGAINKDEEERFMAMLPRSTDSKEMQRKKLIGQRDEMMSRLRTLGFTPEEAGYEAANFNYGMSPEELAEKEMNVAQDVPPLDDKKISAQENLAKMELIRRANQKKTATAGR